MKKIFGFLIAGAVGLSAGVPMGWFLRKKFGEVQFQEVTEEEQINAMIANGDEKLIPVRDEEIKRPEDIQKAIDRMFSKPDMPENLGDAAKEEVRNEMNQEAGIRQMDTQAVAYWKKSQDPGDIVAKYDTRSDEIKEESVELPDDAQEFVNGITEEDDEHFGDGRPTIESASERDWEYWSRKNDGAYDCVEVYWFDEDDILSDDNGNELENPYTFMGFEARKQFEDAEGAKDSGDPDVRYVYNHSHPAIFRLIRRHTSFSRKRGMEEFGSEYDGYEDDADEYLRSRM